MKKINLSITGCMGRMGQQLIKSSKTNRNFKLVSLTENKIIYRKRTYKSTRPNKLQLRDIKKRGEYLLKFIEKFSATVFSGTFNINSLYLFN